MTNPERLTMAEALAKHGSQSIEYRRAWRRSYRKSLRRIDYMPSREACEIIDAAILGGVAVSQPDAIEQALRAWWSDDDPG